MSLKETFRTDKGRDNPSVITNVKKIKKGNMTIVFPGIASKTIKKIAYMINSRDNNINPVILELIAGIALGKYTLESIPALLVILCNPIDVLFEIKFHIIKPKRRQIAKFGIPDLKSEEKTKYNTDKRIKGSRMDQKNPKTEFLYLFFRSPKAKVIIKVRFSFSA